MSVIWKSNGWGQELRIFRDKVIVGILKKSSWKGEAYGEYNGAMLRFKPKNFWNSGTEIFDIEGTRKLGEIEYNSWKSTGKVTFQDEVYVWKYESFWKQNKWKMTGNNESVSFLGTSAWKGGGTIEAEGMEPSLVLIGLFVESYFRSLSSAIGAGW